MGLGGFHQQIKRPQSYDYVCEVKCTANFQYVPYACQSCLFHSFSGHWTAGLVTFHFAFPFSFFAATHVYFLSEKFILLYKYNNA